MKLLFPLLIVSLLIISCQPKMDVKGGEPLVKIGDNILYKSELEENMPTDLSSEDSIIRAEHFIRSWINDVLFYNVALKNNNDKENIDRLVNNYRKSLLIYQYQEQLIDEKLTKELDDRILLDFYNENSEKFKLEETLVKGIFLKIPINAPHIDEVRGWCKSTASASREKLEKYSVHNAVIYDYFVDKWVSFNEVTNNLPVEYRQEITNLNKNMYIEQKDDAHYYFLYIPEFLSPGDNAPFEYAKPTVREMLINKRKIEFLKNTQEDLYARAIKKGEIKFFKE